MIKMTKLEEKIIEAHELGIKFKLVSPGEGPKCVPYDTLNVLQTITDKEFEKSLDVVIDAVKTRTYLKLLRNHNCL